MQVKYSNLSDIYDLREGYPYSNQRHIRFKMTDTGDANMSCKKYIMVNIKDTLISILNFQAL